MSRHYMELQTLRIGCLEFTKSAVVCRRFVVCVFDCYMAFQMLLLNGREVAVRTTMRPVTSVVGHYVELQILPMGCGEVAMRTTMRPVACVLRCYVDL